MVIYSYVVEHDFGLAPNPFGKFCTLAVCKPAIRRSANLEIGDWVVGTGSKALEIVTGRKLRDKIIYAMKVEERLTLEEYWTDHRFQYKKPIMNSSLVAMYGDNFYHKDKNGNWVQQVCAHSKFDNSVHLEHLKVDTGGKNVLIASHFYYFGSNAPSIPLNLQKICHKGIGQKKVTGQEAVSFVKWIEESFNPGIHGDPLNWIKHSQLPLFISPG